jgi:hypothetical protein
MNKIQKIDQIIANLYSRKKYSELNAVSKIFSVSFLEDLENILNENCRNEKCFKEKYNISLGWIDKIPLASFTKPTYDYYGNEIKNKVELGDFVLIYSHSQVYMKDLEKVTQSIDNRAIIVQAKIAKDINPNVPIGRLSKTSVLSTNKELALMSNWPEFDLYKTSASKDKLIDKLNLDTTESNAKFSGYYNKQWFCGNPIYNQTCDISLGELIYNLIEKKDGQLFNPKDIATDWDRLINKLIELCGDYNLPGYIFKKKKSRYVNTGKLYSNPIILFFFFFSKKKFPLLFINRVFEEGKFD